MDRKAGGELKVLSKYVAKWGEVDVDLAGELC